MTQRFAFSVPSTNYKEPMKRYQWQVLPQGMANSPTLCQKFVTQALKTTRSLYSQIYIIHYTDDILLTFQDEELLLTTFAYMQTTLQDCGLIIATEKVQCFPPSFLFGVFSGKKNGFELKR